MIIHLFTGSKGGIGKTRCAISLAMYHLLGGIEKPLLSNKKENFKNKFKLSIYDANVSNIDFFTIMTGKDFQVLAQESVDIYNTYIKQEFGDIFHNKKKLTIEGYAYIRKTPFELFNGVSNFWGSIAEVVEIAKGKKGDNGKKGAADNNTKDVLIVDSNLAVPNLVSDNKAQKIEMKFKFKMLREQGVKQIVIWYIWCLNDFLSIRENLTFSTSQKIELLKRFCQDYYTEGDKVNYTTANEIKLYTLHVLNPYLFFEKKYGFNYFLYRLSSDTNFREILDKLNIGFNLPFEIAVKILVKIIQEISQKASMKSSNAWKDVLESVKEINEKGVNIVLLNDQKENHSYIKEQLTDIGGTSLMEYTMIHKGEFGEDTLWKKIHEFYKWV